MLAPTGFQLVAKGGLGSVPRTMLNTAVEPIQVLFNHAPCGFHSLDPDGIFLHINNTELEWLGYTRDELVGKKGILDLLAPESVPVFNREFPRLKAEGSLRQVELKLSRKDGSIFPVLVNSTAITGADGEFLMSCAVVFDLQQRLDADLRRSAESRFERLLETAPDAIVEVDADGNILLVNRTAEKMFGYGRAELIGKNMELLVPAASRLGHSRHRIAYAHHPRTRPMGIGVELKAQKKDGSLLPVEISLSPMHDGSRLTVIAIIRDVTEHHRAEEMLRRSEERLRQAEKLEALARLAGGTAHEFNNLLTTILGYAELLQPVADTDRAGGYVDKIRLAARRAANLTRQLLAFGRRQVLASQVLDLNVVIKETMIALNRVLGEAIHSSFVPAVLPAWIRADASQIEQIVANLVLNAREAMPEGGTLTVSLENVELMQGIESDHPGLTPGAYVLLRVSDTGIGMKPEVQARLFEPFFSTRDFGQGAGLGLATVYGIVSQSGGTISVHSLPGQGTTFNIYLPRLQESEVAAAQSLESKSALHGSETILLVEDQPHVLALSHEFLTTLGYTVLAATDAEQALTASREFPGNIDLLLTDVIMPGMNGRELALRLKQERASLRVLYVSGFSDEAFTDQGPEEGDDLLEKPFELEELASRIRRVLTQ